MITGIGASMLRVDSIISTSDACDDHAEPVPVRCPSASLSENRVQPVAGALAESGPDLEALLKRGFDIAFAAVFQIVSLQFLVLLATALKLDSPGPLFFVQQRVGRHGRLFRCFKFRTMRVDA